MSMFDDPLKWPTKTELFESETDWQSQRGRKSFNDLTTFHRVPLYSVIVYGAVSVADTFKCSDAPHA